MRKLGALQMGSRLRVVAALLLLSTLLAGCATATLAERGLLPEVQARRPPRVDLGSELALLDERATLSTSLIGADGRAHIFVTDTKKQLYHIEVLGDKVVARDLLGVTDIDEKSAFDAVEQPRAKLRVLVGDKQYIRIAPDGEWQELKGNRCARFVPVGDDLFCAFVIRGAEIGAPKRKDVTAVLLLILPVFWWSNTQAAKLVLAQESHDGWTIRAVLDPDTNRDADPNFMVGTDSRGTLHFFYTTSVGGAFAIVGGGVGAVGVPPRELRYAQVALDRLLPHPTEAHYQAPSPVTASAPWLSIQGATLPPMPFIKACGQDSCSLALGKNLTVDEASGEVVGLMTLFPIGGSSLMLDDGTRRLSIGPFLGGEDLTVEVGIRDGQWRSGINVVAARGLPDSTYYYWFSEGAIKIDPRGNRHALFGHCETTGFLWRERDRRCFRDYLVKDISDWSAPLSLGTSFPGGYHRETPTLAVTDSGSAFAAWVNKEGKFIGRWIRPRRATLQ